MHNSRWIDMWYVGVATLYIFLASRSDGLPACSAAAARRWNAALALFSALGVAQLAPLLLGQLRRRSAVDVLCDATYWIDDPWALAFVLSKVVELGDTVLLLARGKPLSFLHVYHHSSVLVFSAHAYHVRNPAGLWYMVLNLLVHSLMYTYYCAPRALRWLAPYLTLLQLQQMVVGAAAAAAASLACGSGTGSNLLGVGIYLSYLALFGQYFCHRYM
jgi:elongation of very long chain fatty acids protein 6